MSYRLTDREVGLWQLREARDFASGFDSEKRASLAAAAKLLRLIEGIKAPNTQGGEFLANAAGDMKDFIAAVKKAKDSDALYGDYEFLQDAQAALDRAARDRDIDPRARAAIEGVEREIGKQWSVLFPSVWDND